MDNITSKKLKAGINQTFDEIVSAPDKCLDFLEAAANLYKYDLPNILAIYFQNPNATAVATFDVWTKALKCKINKNEHGIRIFSDTAYSGIYASMFDVAQTTGASVLEKSKWRFTTSRHNKILLDALQSNSVPTDISEFQTALLNITQFSFESFQSNGVCEFVSKCAAVITAKRLQFNFTDDFVVSFVKAFPQLTALQKKDAIEISTKISRDILLKIERGIRDEHKRDSNLGQQDLRSDRQHDNNRRGNNPVPHDEERHYLSSDPTSRRDTDLRDGRHGGTSGGGRKDERGHATAEIQPASIGIPQELPNAEIQAVPDVGRAVQPKIQGRQGLLGTLLPNKRKNDGISNKQRGTDTERLGGIRSTDGTDIAHSGGAHASIHVGNIRAGNANSRIESEMELPNGSFIFVGEDIEFDGREYCIESVNHDLDKVQLRDLTFERENGYPIFNAKILSIVEDYIGAQIINESEYTPLMKSIEDKLEPAPDVTIEELLRPLPKSTPLEEKIETNTALTLADIIKIPLNQEKVSPSKESKKDNIIAETEKKPMLNDFVIMEDTQLNGAKTKFKANIDAITLSKLLSADNRNATADELRTLSAFTGWGGLATAFDENNQTWVNENAELKKALTEEEYINARASTLTSFYTSKTVIDSIYSALQSFGFKGGNILEPSMSIGKFFGCMPQEMRNNSNLYGVEIDTVPAAIAKQLYPSADIFCGGFEETAFSNNLFDVAIGNVPFGDYKVFDHDYNNLNFNIHDYFFAKTIDKVRPGGVLAFITSKGTLDKKDSRARQHIFERCDMIGAIRLPNTAFKSAGTEVTSDIIFLQKREQQRIYEDIPYLNTVDIGDGIEVNEYFAENAHMMLGVMTKDSNMYGSDNITTLTPVANGVSLEEQLATAISNLHAEIKHENEQYEETPTIAAPANVQNFSLATIDGKVYYRRNSEMILQNYTETQIEKVVLYCQIRETLHELLDLQISPTASDTSLSEKRDELNNLYDAFVKKFGNLSLRTNEKLFQTDRDANLIRALEDNDNGCISKAPIFTVRTVSPVILVKKVDSAVDALTLSISNRGFVDFEYMQSLCSLEKETILSDLKGQIFLNPKKQDEADAYCGYETASEYLSGDIREKISVATIYAETNNLFKANIEALTLALPNPITPGEIDIRLGATWVDEKYYNQFMYELLKTPNWKQSDPNSIYASKTIGIKYNKFTNSYSISNKQMDSSANVTSIYGTDRINAYEIIEQSLNLHSVVIKDAKPAVSRNGNDTIKYVVNSKETAIARQKQEQIHEQFKSWVFSDKERRDTLCEVYNRLFNSIRHRKYDGSNLELPGMTSEIKLRPHQLNAVARIRSGNNTLLAHVVGSGKTYTMIAGAREQLRLHMATKAMFVVPNHLIGQFSNDIILLYPDTNLLASTKEDFEKNNRQRFLSRIAMSDAEIIVIGHSQFEKITMSAEYQQIQIEKQIQEITSVISDLGSERGEHFTVKQLEKTKQSLEVQLKNLTDNIKKDKMLTFEQLGINSLFVDEAHYFKNCSIFSKMRNVAGISNGGAKKSFDMLLKAQYIHENSGSVTFATGTPISNSLCEMYTMQRYLQNNLLHTRGIRHFDEWASTFGETKTSLELAPEGGGYRLRTRFSSFYNLPELMQLFCEVADIQTADMLDLPTPLLEGGKPTVISCNPSPALEAFMKLGIKRVSAIRDGLVSPYEDNMLKFIGDFRKAGLDMRLIDSSLEIDPAGKLAACAENAYTHYINSSEFKGTQLIFCDTSTYNPSRPFDVYREEKRLLVAMGIPEEEIAFIHTAKTDNQKDKMFADVRSGTIRILLGSTQKCGAGTNIQDRLVALHHLDCPYRPSDIEQREGRILRQGNMNETVSIFRYVTERSFDAYLWNIVETKQRFISQLMRGETTSRVCEDLDEISIGFAEAQAIASGDPRIKEKIELDTDIKRLNILKAQYLNEKYKTQDMVTEKLPQELQMLDVREKKLLEDIERRDTAMQSTMDFKIIFNNTVYDSRETAGEYLNDLIKTLPLDTKTEIGELLSFKVRYYLQNLLATPKLFIAASAEYEVEMNLNTNSGNIIRLENAIKAIDEKLLDTQRKIQELTQSLESLAEKIDEPFKYEAEYALKSARLAELNVELDVGGEDNCVVDDEQLEREDDQCIDLDDELEA